MVPNIFVLSHSYIREKILLFLKGVDTRQCVSKDAGLKGGGFGGGPTSIGQRNECQRGCWAPKGVDCDVPPWLGRRTKHPL